jgi:hypothetical protein
VEELGNPEKAGDDEVVVCRSRCSFSGMGTVVKSHELELGYTRTLMHSLDGIAARRRDV